MIHLGQHFLRDRNVLARIARETLSINGQELITNNFVIEIGPGHGELTDALLAAGAKKIIAIEKDWALASELRKKYGDKGKVEVIEGDVREILPKLFENCLPTADLPKGEKLEIGNSSHAVAGNIPYYLTGYLLRLLGEIIINHSSLINKVVLLIQKEVAERACVTAPHANLLSSMIQGWAKPRVAFTVPRGAFAPPPKVSSALLVLTPLPREELVQLSHYFEITKLLFAHPRKTLLNNFREGFSLDTRRAEQFVRDLDLLTHVRPSLLTPSHIKMLVKMVYN